MSAATIDQARMPGLWPDAANIPDDTLTLILGVAWSQCAVFLGRADGDTLPSPVPDTWVLGNVYQARELWRASRAEADVIGFDTFAVTPRPLTSTVKAILRPLRAVPIAIRGATC